MSPYARRSETRGATRETASHGGPPRTCGREGAAHTVGSPRQPWSAPVTAGGSRGRGSGRRSILGARPQVDDPVDTADEEIERHDAAFIAHDRHPSRHASRARRSPAGRRAPARDRRDRPAHGRPPRRGFYDECMKAAVQFLLGFMKPSAAFPFGGASPPVGRAAPHR